MKLSGFAKMKGRNFMLRCISSAPAVALLLCASAFGQVNTATVYGSVTDPTGAALAGAHVGAKNQLTGASLSTTSNREGQFTFNFVPVGQYSLSADAAGFEGEIRDKVDLSAGQSLHLEFQLKVGNVRESVTVSGQAAVLNFDGAEQHGTIESQNVHELPLASWIWTNLLQLGTGISKAGTGGIVMNGLAPASFRPDRGRNQRLFRPRAADRRLLSGFQCHQHDQFGSHRRGQHHQGHRAGFGGRKYVR